MQIQKRKIITLDKNNVHEQFRWDDPTVYRWSVVEPSSKHPIARGFDKLEQAITTIVLAIASPFLALFIIMLICGFLGWLWEPLRFWGGVFFFAGGLFAYIIDRAGYTSIAIKRALNHYFLYLALVMACIIFLFILPNSPIAAQCSGVPDNWETTQLLNPWLLYFGEHARDLLSFGLAEVVYGSISTIEPEGFWAIAATITFRWLVSIAIVELFLDVRGIFIRRNTFHATVQSMYIYCDNIQRFNPKSMVRRVGILRPSSLHQRFSASAFFQAFVQRAANEGSVEMLSKLSERWGQPLPLDIDPKDPYGL